MDNTEKFLIEMKCQILDILFSKKLQGQTEVPVSELLYEMGMDEESNLTGLNPLDTISLTGRALENIEETKKKLRASFLH